MTDPRPPQDVDALARRLPRREPSAERSAAMRFAVLDAAQGQSAPTRGPARGWWLGIAAAAATACVWLALRTQRPSQPTAPTAQRAASSAVAGTAGAPSAPVAATPGAPAGATPSAPGVDGRAAAPAEAAANERIPDGVTTFAAAHPLHLARGDATITAPPDAQFDVEVRHDEVKRVTVMAGWVVVAGSRTKTTVVPMRTTWTPEAPAPQPTATAAVATVAPTPPPRPPPSAERATPALRDARPFADAMTHSDGSAAGSAAPQRRAAEQDFRDGLRTLLTGDPRGATAALDRACGAPSSSQDDSCYWAAVAWLRGGDRTRARRAFTEMLARWPGSTHVGEAHVALGWLLLEIGDCSAARMHFAAAADDRVPSVRASAVRGLTASQ
jgi:hypothetical protein